MEAVKTPNKRYIAGIDFISSWSKIQTNNRDIILQDLNEESAGLYLYPIKKWTDNPNEAVSYFAFIQDFNKTPPGF